MFMSVVGIIPRFHGYHGRSGLNSYSGQVQGFVHAPNCCQLAGMASRSGMSYLYKWRQHELTRISAQLINFRYMPLPYRVPFQSTCGVFWTLYLSIVNSRYVSVETAMALDSQSLVPVERHSNRTVEMPYKRDCINSISYIAFNFQPHTRY